MKLFKRTPRKARSLNEPMHCTRVAQRQRRALELDRLDRTDQDARAAVLALYRDTMAREQRAALAWPAASRLAQHAAARLAALRAQLARIEAHEAPLRSIMDVEPAKLDPKTRAAWEAEARNTPLDLDPDEAGYNV